MYRRAEAVICLRLALHTGTGCTQLGEDGELALYNPRSGARKQFKYDRIFGSESTQEEVYEDTKALIRSVLDGEGYSCDNLDIAR